MIKAVVISVVLFVLLTKASASEGCKIDTLDGVEVNSCKTPASAMVLSLGLLGKAWEPQFRMVKNSRGWNIGSIITVKLGDHKFVPIAWALNSVGEKDGWAHGERMSMDMLDALARRVPDGHLSDFTTHTNLEPCWMCATEFAVRYGKEAQIYFARQDAAKSFSDMIRTKKEEQKDEKHVTAYDVGISCARIVAYAIHPDVGFMRNPYVRNEFRVKLERCVMNKELTTINGKGQEAKWGEAEENMDDRAPTGEKHDRIEKITYTEYHVKPDAISDVMNAMEQKVSEKELEVITNGKMNFPDPFLSTESKDFHKKALAAVNHDKFGGKQLLDETKGYASDEKGKYMMGFFKNGLVAYVKSKAKNNDALLKTVMLDMFGEDNNGNGGGDRALMNILAQRRTNAAVSKVTEPDLLQLSMRRRRRV